MKLYPAYQESKVLAIVWIPDNRFTRRDYLIKTTDRVTGKCASVLFWHTYSAESGNCQRDTRLELIWIFLAQTGDERDGCSHHTLNSEYIHQFIYQSENSKVEPRVKPEVSSHHMLVIEQVHHTWSPLPHQNQVRRGFIEPQQTESSRLLHAVHRITVVHHINS